MIVVPGTQYKTDWKWHAEERFGQQKPVFDEVIAKSDQKLLMTEPGRAVVFHYDLLHGGAENIANTTRVSVEFTLLVKKALLAARR